MECKEVTLSSMEENYDETKEAESNPGGVSQLSNTEPSGQLWEVKIFYDFDNSEAPLQHVPIYVDSSGASTSNVFENPTMESFEPVKTDMMNELPHLEASGKSPYSVPRLEESETTNPLLGIQPIQPKFQEKTMIYEHASIISEGSGEKKRRGRKSKQTNEGDVSDFLRTKNHLRYLLHRITYEQSLIDAYSAEGWKRQSVEKLKPEKELQHARSHILRYKLKIRDLFKCIDQSLAVGKLPESLFDFKGEINSEDIFCAKCYSKDLTVDNDIILCDGACQRGFHQFCLYPPLLKEQIPPGDESWLCPGCDCKVDCIHMLKDFQESKVSIFDNWEKIFPEAAAAVLGKKLDDGSGSPSPHIEDSIYDHDKPDEFEKILGNGPRSIPDESSFLRASQNLVATVDDSNYPGLPSDDSEDDDFDPSAPDKDELEKQESCSSDYTSESEDLGGVLDDADMHDEISVSISSAPCHEWPYTGSIKQKCEVDGVERESLNDDRPYLLENCNEPSSSKRHKERLDYKKLHDETYGKFSDSSDEDFEVFTAQKRRIKINSVTKNKRGIEEESEHCPLKTRKRFDCDSNNSLIHADFTDPILGRSEDKCLNQAETQILAEPFKENQLSEKVATENLAKGLGLTIQQVGEWSNNTTRMFHHTSQMISCGTENASGNCTSFRNEDKPSEPGMLSSTEKASSIDQSHVLHPTTENPVTDTSQENS